MGRFDYIRYSETAKMVQAHFKGKFEELEADLLKYLGEGRPQSLALTNLEEAYMWIGKAIRDRQIAAGETLFEEERSKS